MPDPSKSVVIEKPVIVEKPVFVPVSGGKTEKGVLESFTIFRTVKISFGSGKFKVVTGLNYPNSNSSVPELQYCYITRGSLEDLSKNYYLARKIGFRDVGYTKLSQSAAEFFQISLNDLTTARKHCKFLSSSPGDARNGSGTTGGPHPAKSW